MKQSPSAKPKLLEEPSSRVNSIHPNDNNIRDLEEGVRLHRRVVNNLTSLVTYPKLNLRKTEETFSDECWVNVMHEKLNQFIKTMFGVWYLGLRIVTLLVLS